MQISKLEWRLLIAIAVVVVGILAVVIVPRLVAPASAPAGQSADTPATATATPSPTVVPSPAPTPQTEQQILDSTVASTVRMYSVLVCSRLQQYDSVSIPAIIKTVLAEYPTTGLSEQSRQIMAERVLTESAAKSCPDQSPRVASGSTQG